MRDNKYSTDFDLGWLAAEKYFREHYELIPIDKMLLELEREMKNGTD